MGNQKKVINHWKNESGKYKCETDNGIEYVWIFRGEKIPQKVIHVFSDDVLDGTKYSEWTKPTEFDKEGCEELLQAIVAQAAFDITLCNEYFESGVVRNRDTKQRQYQSQGKIIHYAPTSRQEKASANKHILDRHTAERFLKRIGKEWLTKKIMNIETKEGRGYDLSYLRSLVRKGEKRRKWEKSDYCLAKHGTR